MAFLLLFLTPGFVLADNNEEVLKQLSELQKSINSLRTDLQGRAQKTEADILSLQKSVNSINSELTGQVQKNSTDVASLKRDISSIRQEIKSLQQQGRSEIDTRPLAMPGEITPPPIAPTMATVIFYNSYSQPMQVTCNGQTFVVQPGEQKNIEVATSSYTYLAANVQGGPYNIAPGEVQRVTLYYNGWIQPEYPSYYYYPGRYYYSTPGCHRPFLRFFRGCELQTYQRPYCNDHYLVGGYRNNHALTITNGKQTNTYLVNGNAVNVGYHPFTHTHPTQYKPQVQQHRPNQGAVHTHYTAPVHYAGHTQGGGGHIHTQGGGHSGHSGHKK